MNSKRSFKALLAFLLVIVFATPVTAKASAAKKTSTRISSYEAETSEPSEETEETEPTETSEEASSPTAALNGFKTLNGRKVYYVNGAIQKGFVKINRHYYYFDKNGYMVKGFRRIGKYKYYFSSNGRMLKGFHKIGKYRYFFSIKGRMVKGFRKIGRFRYYFNAKGHMLTGRRKIRKSHYYFLKNGHMKTGLVRIKGKTFFYSKKTGKRVQGLLKTGKSTYFFKKSGAAFTGFGMMKHKGKRFRVYFDKKGKLKKGTFRVGKVEYKAGKKLGRIYSYRNLARAQCQLPEMPSGCEITSWTMMANFAGVKMSKTKAAAIMPRSHNPNKGFMGSPYMVTGDGLVIYPDGLKKITSKYLHGYKNLTGCELKKLKENLRAKKLVLVWVYGLGFNWSHTVVLTGYDDKGFFYNDPYTGKKAKISYSSFDTKWHANGTMAMTY